MLFILLLTLCSCQFYDSGCHEGKEILILKTIENPVTGQTVYLKTMGCYCPKDYMGTQCQIHIELVCTLRMEQTSFDEVSGQMVADCKDYTEAMYEGVKPDIEGGNIPSDFKILWTNRSQDYDRQGNLIRPDAQNVSISFNYSNVGSKFSFTKTEFRIQTSLVPWKNGLRHQPVCQQQIDANDISGQPFEFNCQFNPKDYRQYSNYGVYTLQSYLISRTETIPHQITIRTARHHVYDSQYVESGNWKSSSPVSLGTKILTLALFSGILYICFVMYRRWKNQSNISYR